MSQAVEQVEQLIAQREPRYVITANLNYLMIHHRRPDLESVARRAAFLTADGITLVWRSRWGRRIPERVTGADLLERLCDVAARKGYRVFLLGAAPAVATGAASALRARYPGLQVVGTESPVVDRLSPRDHDALITRIRDSRPDLLFVALGQPKGELWLAKHVQELGVPACIQIGGALDYASGHIRRAPHWLLKLHMETPFRIWMEPRRLTPRYTRNALFLATMIARDLGRALARLPASARRGRRHRPAGGGTHAPSIDGQEACES